MRILFVSSGNRKQGLNPIIRLQAESLEKVGVEIEHFLIFGSGFLGYLKNVFKLRRHLKTHTVDLIHAHFGFSCVVAQFSKGNTPLVVTLMGTDILGHKDKSGEIRIAHMPVLWVNRFFANYVFKTVIVKSRNMQEILRNRTKPTFLIPNGVDMSLFYQVQKNEALQFLQWDSEVHHFVFISNPARPEKNFPLAEAAVKLLQEKGYRVQLHAVFQEKSENLKYYYSAATALLLTSFHEGSPNVIKEALCCNCPIVSTDVGDVRSVTAGLDGCYLAPFDASGFAAMIHSAIRFSELNGRIAGRKRIGELGLDSRRIAEMIKGIYND